MMHADFHWVEKEEYLSTVQMTLLFFVSDCLYEDPKPVFSNHTDSRHVYLLRVKIVNN